MIFVEYTKCTILVEYTEVIARPYQLPLIQPKKIECPSRNKVIISKFQCLVHFGSRENTIGISHKPVPNKSGRVQCRFRIATLGY